MKKIAVFDFDGTITRCDTFIGIIRHTYGLWALMCGMGRLWPQLLRWKLGRISNSEAKRLVFSHFFTGMSEKGFQGACRRYFDATWPRIIRLGAKVAISNHLKAGDTVVIVSASPSGWVKPFAYALGVDTVISTETAVNSDGRLADHFASPNCYGQEKVNRLTEMFGDKASYHLTAYGDSKGDSEMLAFADVSHYKPFRN